MSDFRKMSLTELGKDLLARTHTGVILDLENIVIGNGEWTAEEQNGNPPTELKFLQRTVAISSVEQNGKVAVVHGILSNADLENGFSITEIGVTAKHPIEGEILYMADYAPEDKSSYIQDKDGAPIEIPIKLEIMVSDTQDVTLTITDSFFSASKEDLANDLATHNADETAHPELFAQVSKELPRILKPENVSPVDLSAGVVAPISFQGSAYFSLYSIPQKALHYWIATDANMVNIVKSGTVNGVGTVFDLSNEDVAVDENYWWTIQYEDKKDNLSEVSEPTAFSTASIFLEIANDGIIAPVNGATHIMDGPEISGFYPIISGPTSADYSHINTDWILARDEALTDIVEQSLADTVNLNSWLSSKGLAEDLPYWVGRLVRFSDGANTVDGNLQKISFQTAPSFITNYWGDGTDGDVTITANTFLPVPNGDMIVKNYKSLKINSDATLTVDDPCRGLLIYVDGDCEINGALSFDNMGLCTVDPTKTISSDGAKMPTSGLVIAKHMGGGTDSGNSNLLGCGFAALNSEQQQQRVDNGFVLTLTPGCCGKGGDGGNGNTSGWGLGGPGVLGNYCGGSGGGGGAPFVPGGRGGGGGAGGAGTGGRGGITSQMHPQNSPQSGLGGLNGIGGNGGSGGAPNYSNSGENGGNGAAGLLILIVRGELKGTGVISSSSTFSGGDGGTGGGGPGGGCVTVLHGQALSSTLSVRVDGGSGGIGLANNGHPGAAGTIVTQQIDI
ncbi:phage tail protein [Maridesulfovibrio ferrireducens]|uniref:phage tail-collar fiber domain-containing protein n=1 Tax=Maridesulfovibrio ferrireducens TaxID=246191 RepID=UPI001A290122|nr:phage tail protein [Maridesulfovibrio ferrireducens]MBI9110118.1 phage tail protein [Maridesulfovibrio ferrireducens]